MSGKYILENHKPVPCDDLFEWSNWFETVERHVAKTLIGIPAWKFWLGELLKIRKWKPVRVSTVFLGVDYNFSENGEPILFETMVFGGEYNGEQERYVTWEEAEKGHQKWVKKVKGIKI